MTASSIEIMDGPSAGPDERAEAIRSLALGAGFSRARFLVLFSPREAEDGEPPPGYAEGAPALLVVALPYGNDDPDGRTPERTHAENSHAAAEGGAHIAPFARRNYYAEAVSRLKTIAVELRKRYGGVRSDYRILCNSPIPEKPLAERCGLGATGRNTLIITGEAGSLVILAAMTLPFAVRPDGPIGEVGSICGACSACVSACPTGALRGDGTMDRSRCLQWYASGHGDPPEEIVAAWGNILYGCTVCQDACPHNRRAIPGVATERGSLPAELDAAGILAMSDEELSARFRGTAMGMAWLGPAAIRRNAELALKGRKAR
jgi:epoxyqueuosine reductase